VRKRASNARHSKRFDGSLPAALSASCSGAKWGVREHLKSAVSARGVTFDMKLRFIAASLALLALAGVPGCIIEEERPANTAPAATAAAAPAAAAPAAAPAAPAHAPPALMQAPQLTAPPAK
jgi:hypothetical protein